jgi:hypothetical protein
MNTNLDTINDDTLLLKPAEECDDVDDIDKDNISLLFSLLFDISLLAQTLEQELIVEVGGIMTRDLAELAI